MRTRASGAAVSERTTHVRSATATPTKTAARPKATGALGFKNILVPFDFSKPAEIALQYALTFAKQFEAKITLVYVVEPPAFADFDANPLILDNDAVVLKARQKLEAIRLQQEEDADFISEEIKVTVGKPFHEISSLARGLRQDLIIISTHGRTALTHVLLGSTAEKVVRHAPCPVLVVRSKEKAG